MDAVQTKNIRAKRPTFKIALYDSETDKLVSIRIGAHTSGNTIAELISSRLLLDDVQSQSLKRKPIGVIIDDVLNSFDTLYVTLEEMQEANKLQNQYQLVFQTLPHFRSSNTAETEHIQNKEIEGSILNDSKMNSSDSAQIHHPSFSFKPIGYIKSCFPRKNGCPRQGRLTPHSSASIQVIAPRSSSGARINSEDALEGLEQHSHVWVIFVFHANQEQGESESSIQHGGRHIRAKVHPPRMGGKSIGVYSTRSPHRFVPIGLTACKLDRVEKDTIYLSGVDLIDGTPILDIKPYIPAYDRIEDAKTEAEWIESGTSIQQVMFTPESLIQLESLSPTCQTLEGNTEIVKNVIIEMLLADPRSVYRKEKCENQPFGFHLDKLNIQCKVEENIATVYNIENIHKTT